MNRLREFFGSYTELIKENADIVSALESTLESALYLLPSQVSGGGETTSEALYSAVSLLSLFHDLIFIRDLRKKLSSLQMLRRAVSSRTQTQKRPSFASEPNPLNRQLQTMQPKWWVEGGATLLGVASAFELFIEMWAAHSPRSESSQSKKSSSGFNESKRWAAIFFVELFKVIVRLYMLLKSRGSILVMQSHPDRGEVREQIKKADKEIDLLNQQIEQMEADPSFSETLQREPRFTLIDHAKRQAKMVDGGLISWENFWKAQQPSQIVSAYIPTRPTLYQTIGELAHILRPLIYVMLIINCGRKSWRPWLISLIIELFSFQMSFSSSQKPLNETELEEMKRRKMLFLYYLVRAPFYDNVLLRFLRGLPFVSFFCSFKWIHKLSETAQGIIEGYRDYYFYLAGSSA